VQEVLRTALDPLIDRTLRENPVEPRRALLRLRVLDPACGSGHFLLGAARRLAAEVARLDSEGDLPEETLRRHALREVVRRCIYGVDRNPLSVELCRTALWIESIEPGKPLSFLDAHIRCGDALVGVTNLRVLGEGIPDGAFVPFIGDDPAAASTFKRMNKAQRESAPHTLDLGISLPGDFALSLESLSEEAEDSVEIIVRKRRRLEELRSSGIGWRLRNACDLWTAAFFAIKVMPDIKGRELCPSTDAVWRYLRGTTPYGPLIAETDRLAQYYRFFHWPLEFPDAARDGGFDVILGNPPWETTSPDAKEFFAVYDPQVRFMSNEEQKAAYERLKEHPVIRARWDAYCRDLYTHLQGERSLSHVCARQSRQR
jgi:SAM-dependent methyltransferase